MWEILIISAFVQGLTEFLPVSSSGHLRLLQHWFGLEEPQTFVDLCLHLGTLVAVVWFYRGRLKDLACSVLPSSRGKATMDRRLLLLLIAGTVPTGLIGVFMGGFFEEKLSSVFWVGVWLSVTGGTLWWTRGKEEGERGLDTLHLRDVLIIGVVQGFAVLRGISRSGSTIAVGLGLGLQRGAAAELSFLLSVPAILGAVALKGLEIGGNWHLIGVEPVALLVGTAIAAVVGYVALRFLVALVKQGGLYRFAPYCFFVGILAIAHGI